MSSRSEQDGLWTKIKQWRFKLTRQFGLFFANRQRARAPREGITFGSLSALRKKRQKSGLQKGADRVLTDVQIGQIAKRFKDQRLLKALEFSAEQVLDWDGLKDFSEVVRFTGDHKAYEQAIKQFDDDVTLLSYREATHCCFIGSGLGHGTLNAYRKIEQEDIFYFEKIYLNESDDLVHLQWFEKYCRPLLNAECIRVPKILKMHEGGQITAVYFEFFTDPLDNCSQVLERVINVAFSLYELPLPKLSETRAEIYQFERIEIYNACFEHAQKLLENAGGEKGLSLKSMASIVKGLPHQITHGDLHGKNMGEPNVVIDWDRAGVYPLGLDIAYALSNEYHLIDLDGFYDVLELQCRRRVGEKNWPAFRFSCSYFALLFYTRKLGSKVNENQLQCLYSKLQEQGEELLGA